MTARRPGSGPEQLDAFGQKQPRRVPAGSPDTRRKAYDAALPKMSARQRLVLATLARAGAALTSDAVGHLCGLHVLSIRPVLTRLDQQGYVYRPEGGVGLSALGKRERTYRLTTAGRDWLATTPEPTP